MVTYTTAFLAAANFLALAHAAPAQPVCQQVITVITGSPIWVPRPDPTTSAGWGAWSSKGSSISSSSSKASTTSSEGRFYPVSSTTASWTTASTLTTTITISTTDYPTTTIVPTTSTTASTTTTTTAPPAASTCASTGTDVFNADPSGSCACDFTVHCNMHAPYTSSSNFWERTSGELINSLAECQSICNDNSACTAVIWVNQAGASSSDYLRCWQTSGLPQPDSDGYGQLSYKGSCASSCSTSYSTSG